VLFEFSFSAHGAPAGVQGHGVRRDGWRGAWNSRACDTACSG